MSAAERQEKYKATLLKKSGQRQRTTKPLTDLEWTEVKTLIGEVTKKREPG